MTLNAGWGVNKINKQTNKSEKKSPQATSAGMVNRGKHDTLEILKMGIY